MNRRLCLTRGVKPYHPSPVRRGATTAGALVLALLSALSKAAPLEAQEPIPVSVSPLAELAIYPTREAPATVISLNDSLVASEVSGRIAELPVRVGEVVDKGALIARLDCEDYALERRRLEAALAALDARRQFARFQLQSARSLAVKQNVSEELLNQRQSEMAALNAEWEQQQAGLALAARKVDKCEIRAPFKALVLKRMADLAEWRNAGEPLVRLIDLDSIEVSAQVLASDVEAMKGGGALAFIDDGQRYPLSLRAAVPAVTTRSRTREVRLTFEGPAALPGTAGTMIWRSDRPHVPPDLLVERDGRLGVFAINDGHARFHALQGALEGRPAAAPLPQTTAIVVDGRYALRDGDPVTVGP
jgi:RND family efflux transporter MFP subunit